MSELSTMQERWKEEIKVEIQKLAQKRIGTILDIRDVDIIKFNDQQLTGITLINPESDISAGVTMYLNGAFSDLASMRGTPKSIAKLMYNTFVEHSSAPKDLGFSAGKPNLREHLENGRLTMMVCDGNLNKKYLEDKPSVDLDTGAGDKFKAIFAIRTGDQEQFTAVITNKMAKELGMDTADLYEKAIQGLTQNNRPTLVSMKELAKAEMDHYDVIPAKSVDPLTAEHGRNTTKKINPISDAFMLTTERPDPTDGTAFFFYPGMQGKLADLCMGNYYAIPSSRSEFMIYPDRVLDMDAQGVCKMLRDVNQAYISPEEKLSDLVFHYDAKDKVLKAVLSNEPPYPLSLKDLAAENVRVMNSEEYTRALTVAAYEVVDQVHYMKHAEGKTMMPAAKFIDECKRLSKEWTSETDPKLAESVAYYLDHSPYAEWAEKGKMMNLKDPGEKTKESKDLQAGNEKKQQKDRRDYLEL